MITYRELKKRLIYLLKGDKSCKSCTRRNESFVNLKGDYIVRVKALEESEELLKLALGKLDLRKVIHKDLKFKVNNRKFS